MANLTEVSHMARSLMNEHGLGHVPFEFDRAKNRLGSCRYLKAAKQPVKITVSKHYAALLEMDELRDVVLHEIAHALTPGHHHDAVWRAMARKVGAQPKRCAAPSASPESAWEARCPAGHKGRAQHRAPLRVKSCGACSTTWKGENILLWHKNGVFQNVYDMPERYRTEFFRVMEAGKVPTTVINKIVGV